MDKDLLNDQRKHLKAVTHWADQIKNELSPILNTHSGQVHFRPNSRGFSMVGLLPKRPQRGRSGLRNAKRVAEDFPALFETYCVLPPQGRSTPEKELQSWMTAEAYRNNRQFLCIDQSTTEDTHTLFVADELALPQSQGRRIVCDFLALRVHSSGEMWPAVIELKSARQLKRLVEQVVGYAECVNALSADFEAFYSIILGRKITFSRPAEKWIVWPQAGEIQDPRESELATMGIRVVGYTTTSDGFRFRTGAPIQ